MTSMRKSALRLQRAQHQLRTERPRLIEVKSTGFDARDGAEGVALWLEHGRLGPQMERRIKDHPLS